MRPALLMTVLLLVAGCATVEGAGRDLSTAGSAVSNAAREVRQSF